MRSTITPSRYKDQPAITLESETIVAQFLPDVGAKLCSLIYKPANLELLLQRPNETYRLAPYDGDYVAQGECSGFDEMFPSIDRSFYEGYPWRGTPIPDHGEVWSLPWTCATVQKDPISVEGRVSACLHSRVILSPAALSTSPMPCNLRWSVAACRSACPPRFGPCHCATG